MRAGEASREPEEDAERTPTHAAKELTRGGTRARIELDGQIYVLRITRAGKLILTK